MDEQGKIALADEIRELVKSLNEKIRNARRHSILVEISQEKGYYSNLTSEPQLISVEIREEHIL